MLDNGLLVN